MILCMEYVTPLALTFCNDLSRGQLFLMGGGSSRDSSPDVTKDARIQRSLISTLRLQTTSTTTLLSEPTR